MVQSPEAGAESLGGRQRVCHLVFECEKCDSKAMILQIQTNNGTATIYYTHVLVVYILYPYTRGLWLHKTQRNLELLLQKSDQNLFSYNYSRNTKTDCQNCERQNLPVFGFRNCKTTEMLEI